MDEGKWLVGWRQIGKYIGKSAKTAQRYARDGMPFCRDPGGRPIAKPSMIDAYIVELNREWIEDKAWRDEGIKTALAYEDDEKKKRKEFDERMIDAQRRPRSRF